MALRVKRVAAGFVDSSGFHPSGRGESAVRKRRRPKRKATAAPHTRSRVRARSRARARSKNPISAKWVRAQVRRVGKDIQVMLFPKARVRKARSRSVRRRRR